MLKSGKTYSDAGELYYEQKYRDYLLKRLHKQAALFGFQLTPAAALLEVIGVFVAGNTAASYVAYAESETNFFIKVNGPRLSFIKNDKRDVTTLSLHDDAGCRIASAKEHLGPDEKDSSP